MHNRKFNGLKGGPKTMNNGEGTKYIITRLPDTSDEKNRFLFEPEDKSKGETMVVVRDADDTTQKQLKAIEAFEQHEVRMAREKAIGIVALPVTAVKMVVRGIGRAAGSVAKSFGTGFQEAKPFTHEG